VVCQGGKQGAHPDKVLSKAIGQGSPWTADDLGVGAFKKCLNDNMHRSLVLVKAGAFWVFAYLFAKKDRANIGDALLALRNLALYRGKAKADLEAERKTGALLEIDHGN